MRVTVTGGTGLIGTRLVRRLQERGDEVTTLSLRREEPGPKLDGRDAVVHLAGENLAQRWTAKARREIQNRASSARAGSSLRCRTASKTLVCASAVGYYGPRGDEEIDRGRRRRETTSRRACAWPGNARPALPTRGVVIVRTGVVLDASGGALAKMLLPFRLGLGGPVAGGHQYMAWIHVDDLVGIYVAALDDPQWQGPVNATAPNPVTNAEFSKALGRALHRPAVAPDPRLRPACAVRRDGGDRDHRTAGDPPRRPRPRPPIRASGPRRSAR